MASETKFTPGPWEIGCGFGLYGVRIDASDRAICGVSGVTRQVYNRDGSPAGEVDMPEGWANARLIAAAPELYEALVCLLARAENELADPEDVHEVVFAKATISKARGEA